MEIAARFRPAGEANEVGGDFYDIFETAGGRWALVIGDVCGKGADAAAVTAIARYTLRAAAMQAEEGPEHALRLLNDVLMQQVSPDRFCTVAYATLDLDDGDGATVGRLGRPSDAADRARPTGRWPDRRAGNAARRGPGAGAFRRRRPSCSQAIPSSSTPTASPRRGPGTACSTSSG